MTTNPIKLLNKAGVKSDYLFYAGLASIGLSLGSWLISRSKPDDDKAQADRWGIFVGHWVPSFFALGVALELEERGLLHHHHSARHQLAIAALKNKKVRKQLVKHAGKLHKLHSLTH